MKKFILPFLACMLLSSSYAQQLPLGSLYYTNMLAINPAFTGQKTYTELFLGHRSQFVGFNNGPKTSYISIAGRLSDQHRVGFSVFTDATALFTKTLVQGNYGYALQFGNQQELVFGLASGLSALELDLSQGEAVDMNDVVYTSLRQTKYGVNADFGLMYQLRGFQLGVSVPQLFNSAQTFELANDKTYSYKNTSHIRGTMKYDFYLGRTGTITATPMVMVRSVKGAPLQYDISAIVDHSKWGWFGVTYHSEFAIAISAGVRYKNFVFGYAHDIILGDLQRFSKFSSEFVVGYRIGKRKTNAPKENPEDALDFKVADNKKEDTNGATDDFITEENTPSEDELTLMRQEIEKKRREKALALDSTEKAVKSKNEQSIVNQEEALAEANQRAAKTDTKVETTQPKEAKTESKSQAVKAKETTTNENKKVNDLIDEAERKFNAQKEIDQSQSTIMDNNSANNVKTIDTDPSKTVNTPVKNRPETGQNSGKETASENLNTPVDGGNVTTKESYVEGTNQTANTPVTAASETTKEPSIEGAKPDYVTIDKNQLIFDDALNFALFDGNFPKEGFYIILGAFSDPNNTKRFMKALQFNGIDDAFIVTNKQKNLDEVCVFFSGSIGDARKELLKYREQGRKSWILNLK